MQPLPTSLGAVPTTYGPGLAQRLTALAPHCVDLTLDTEAPARGRPRRDHGRPDARRDGR
ncbi:hypothetical protein GCM10018780_49290 [Streptomyces lanatus]|nr:hypothetical protein GCM10018780_49290 [Streptomyces lanatus]